MYLYEKTLHRGMYCRRRHHTVGHIDKRHVDRRLPACPAARLLNPAVRQTVSLTYAPAGSHPVDGMTQTLLGHRDDKLILRACTVAPLTVAPYSPERIAQRAFRVGSGKQPVHRDSTAQLMSFTQFKFFHDTKVEKVCGSPQIDVLF